MASLSAEKSEEGTDSTFGGQPSDRNCQSGTKTECFGADRKTRVKGIRTLQHLKVRKIALRKPAAEVYSPLSLSDAQRLKRLFGTLLPALEVKLEELSNYCFSGISQTATVVIDIRRSPLMARRPGFCVAIKTQV